MKLTVGIKKVATIVAATALALTSVAGPLAYSKVFAATLTKASIQEIGGASFASPMIVSTGQQVALDFKTVAAGATTASVNFNNFTGGTVNATQTISSTGCTTYFPTATLLPGSLSASGATTTVSITGITALSATTEYCTILTSNTAVTNPASANVYSALVTVGSDSQTVAFDVLAVAANAYTITGTVTPSFTMALAGTSGPDIFAGNLTSSALTVTSGETVTINTNAASGWNLYAKDSNAGLTSASAAHTIPSVATGSNVDFSTGVSGPGNETYGLGVVSNATANYAYTTSNHGGGLSSSAFNRIATNSAPAASVGVVLHELANIAGTTQPGIDYTDTITIIGSGQF